MPRFRPTLVARMLRVAEHELFEPPRAWPVLARFPPAELLARHPEPPRTRFSDATLYLQLFKARPEVRSAPLALNDARRARPLARRFVERQVQLMRGGLGRERAFRRAEEEFKQELAALTDVGAGGHVDAIQAQEEQQLRQAARALFKRHAAMHGLSAAANGGGSGGGGGRKR